MAKSNRRTWGAAVIAAYVFAAACLACLLAPQCVANPVAGGSRYDAVMDWLNRRTNLLLVAAALFVAFLGFGAALVVTVGSAIDAVRKQLRHWRHARSRRRR